MGYDSLDGKSQDGGEDEKADGEDSKDCSKEKLVLESPKKPKKVKKKVTISPEVEVKHIRDRLKDDVDQPERKRLSINEEKLQQDKAKNLSVIVEDNGMKSSAKLQRKTSIPDYEKLLKQMKKLSEYNSQHEGVKEQNKSKSTSNSGVSLDILTYNRKAGCRRLEKRRMPPIVLAMVIRLTTLRQISVLSRKKTMRTTIFWRLLFKSWSKIRRILSLGE